MYREASGTSGMTAAMNGSINVSLPDGWVPEFAKDKQNCFIINPAADDLPLEEKDRQEADTLMDILENTVVPMYYNDAKGWLKILKQASKEIIPQFDSGRLADDYYKIMYNAK